MRPRERAPKTTPETLGLNSITLTEKIYRTDRNRPKFAKNRYHLQSQAKNAGNTRESSEKCANMFYLTQ